MLRLEDVPSRFNIASYFVDGNVEAGRGDRPALLTGAGATTYAQLARLVNRVGNALLRIGVRPGDRVLLALSDGVEFVATWYAAQKIGAVTAEVYTYLPVKDYAYFLEYTAPRVVVADAVTIGAVREARSVIQRAGRGFGGPKSTFSPPNAERGAGAPELLVVGAAEPRPGEHSFAELTAAAPDELDAAPTGRDDVAIWKFTTGSTGAPKACVHPAHSPLLSFDWYARGVLDLSADDVVLPVPKLFFGYARDLAALFPFGVGGAGVAFPERSTPERIFELIERHRPTILVNVPTMMAAMVAHPAAATADLSSLRLCTSAGEALPPELARRWHEAFGVDVVDGIGSSEAYHIYLSNRPRRRTPAIGAGVGVGVGAGVGVGVGAERPAERKPGSLGRVVPGYKARIVGDDGTPLADGEVGLLEISGDTVALEYFAAPEKSAATFVGDRTVRSGDLFVRDAGGDFYYRGRADDLLKVGGVWVAPSEIEHCLLAHPDVLECAVVGYSSGGLTLPRAFVVARPGAVVAAADLQQLARTSLSPHKYPRDVRFVAALPRTANGKLDRRALHTL